MSVRDRHRARSLATTSGGGVGLCVRVVSAAVLIVIAVSATLLSWGPLRNVFADYQDSPLWVYLLFGLSWLAIACIAAAGASFSYDVADAVGRYDRRRSPRGGHMAVKLHRCSNVWVKLPGHPCWKVQKALDEKGSTTSS